MSKKREKQIIKEELSRAKKEQASAAIEWNNTTDYRFPKLGLYKAKKRKIKLTFFLLVLIFVLAMAVIWLWKMAFPKAPVMQTSGYLEQMKDLSTLTTAEAYVKVIIEKEDNQIFGKQIEANFPGTKRKILLVVPGSVAAGVDLSRLQEDQLEINEETKVISIELPKADFLQDPAVNFDEVETYSLAGLFRSDVNWEEAYSLMAEAKEKMKEEATEQGIFSIAEANAEKTLKKFYEQLGYNVTIHFISN